MVCPATEQLEAVAACCFHPRKFVLGDDVVYAGPAALQANGQRDTAAAKKYGGDVEGRRREVKSVRKLGPPPELEGERVVERLLAKLMGK